MECRASSSIRPRAARRLSSNLRARCQRGSALERQGAGMQDLNPSFDPALLSRVEDAGLNASAPPQQRWVDGWLVRFSPGKAKRARCVNAVAAGRATLQERLLACEE